MSAPFELLFFQQAAHRESHWIPTAVWMKPDAKNMLSAIENFIAMLTSKKMLIQRTITGMGTHSLVFNKLCWERIFNMIILQKSGALHISAYLTWRRHIGMWVRPMLPPAGTSGDAWGLENGHPVQMNMPSRVCTCNWWVCEALVFCYSRVDTWSGAHINWSDAFLQWSIYHTFDFFSTFPVSCPCLSY